MEQSIDQTIESQRCRLVRSKARNEWPTTVTFLTDVRLEQV